MLDLLLFGGDLALGKGVLDGYFCRVVMDAEGQ